VSLWLTHNVGERVSAIHARDVLQIVLALLCVTRLEGQQRPPRDRGNTADRAATGAIRGRVIAALQQVFQPNDESAKELNSC
jgi:hypothetical protein